MKAIRTCSRCSYLSVISQTEQLNEVSVCLVSSGQAASLYIASVPSIESCVVITFAVKFNGPFSSSSVKMHVKIGTFFCPMGGFEVSLRTPPSYGPGYSVNCCMLKVAKTTLFYSKNSNVL